MGKRDGLFPGLRSLTVETTLSLAHMTPTRTDLSLLLGNMLHTCALANVSVLTVVSLSPTCLMFADAPGKTAP